MLTYMYFPPPRLYLLCRKCHGCGSRHLWAILWVERVCRWPSWCWKVLESTWKVTILVAPLHWWRWFQNHRQWRHRRLHFLSTDSDIIGMCRSVVFAAVIMTFLAVELAMSTWLNELNWFSRLLTSVVRVGKNRRRSIKYICILQSWSLSKICRCKSPNVVLVGSTVPVLVQVWSVVAIMCPCPDRLE